MERRSSLKHRLPFFEMTKDSLVRRLIEKVSRSYLKALLGVMIALQSQKTFDLKKWEFFLAKSRYSKHPKALTNILVYKRFLERLRLKIF